MTGFWPIFFLLVVLKIPVLASMWLVYWAAKQHDEPETVGDEDSGGSKRRPRPKLPRGPRRGGPHGGGAALPAPDCPPGGRTRVVDRRASEGPRDEDRVSREERAQPEDRRHPA